MLGLPARASRPDEFLIDCAERRPSCAAEWAVPTPAAFATRFSTTAGTFTVEVNTSWAPPMAARFHLLSRIGYFDGSPFYRVLDRNATTRFVSQWGYRGVPAVDAAWLKQQTSNQTWPAAPPGNLRGSVAFGTGSAAGPQPPNCTAPTCSWGWSVELCDGGHSHGGDRRGCLMTAGPCAHVPGS